MGFNPINFYIFYSIFIFKSLRIKYLFLFFFQKNKIFEYSKAFFTEKIERRDFFLSCLEK